MGKQNKRATHFRSAWHVISCGIFLMPQFFGMKNIVILDRFKVGDDVRLLVDRFGECRFDLSGLRMCILDQRPFREE
jgi:hypothetical protein